MNKKVAIIGDIIIDKYIYGTSTRLSPEAPIPIVSYRAVSHKLGGAGNVFINLKSLDVDCDLFGEISKEQIELVRDSLGFDRHNCVWNPCSEKTRVFSDGHYIARMDNDKISNGDTMLEKILSVDFSKYEYVIISDYAKGAVEHSLKIIEHCNSFGCKVIVDPKRSFSNYKGAWMIKPNAKENSKFRIPDPDSNLLVTQGGSGAYLVMYKDPIPEGKRCHTMYNYYIDYLYEKVEVKDVTGAGDCFLAAFVYCLVHKFPYQVCLDKSVKAATESVRHVGTYTLRKKDLE